MVFVARRYDAAFRNGRGGRNTPPPLPVRVMENALPGRGLRTMAICTTIYLRISTTQLGDSRTHWKLGPEVGWDAFSIYAIELFHFRWALISPDGPINASICMPLVLLPMHLNDISS